MLCCAFRPKQATERLMMHERSSSIDSRFLVVLCTWLVQVDGCPLNCLLAILQICIST